MRLRRYASVILLPLLFTPSITEADHPATHPLDYALLRTLIARRHALVQRLTAQDATRGQVLSLTALAAADALLVSESKALRRELGRLAPVLPRVTTPTCRTDCAPVAASGTLSQPGTAPMALTGLETPTTRPMRARRHATRAPSRVTTVRLGAMTHPAAGQPTDLTLSLGGRAATLAASSPAVQAALSTLPAPSAPTLYSHVVLQAQTVDSTLSRVRALEGYLRSQTPRPALADATVDSLQTLNESLGHWTLTLPPHISAASALTSLFVLPSAALGATATLHSQGTAPAPIALSGTVSDTGDGHALARTLADGLTNTVALTSRSLSALTTQLKPKAPLYIEPTATPVPPTPTPAVTTGYTTYAPSIPVASGSGATGMDGVAGPDTSAPPASLPNSAPRDTSLQLTAMGRHPSLLLSVRGHGDVPAVTLHVALRSNDVDPQHTMAKEIQALDSIVSRGNQLYATLKRQNAGVEQAYEADLKRVVAANAVVEQDWYVRFNAYTAYTQALASYKARVKAFNAYAHRVHAAQIAYDAWLAKQAAWVRYTRELATYHAALAVGHGQPLPTPTNDALIPITGSAPTSVPTVAPTMPPPPAPVPPPGPSPTPLRAQAPAWPGVAPARVANPGPEPVGEPLPDPPPSLPPWNSNGIPVAPPSYGGLGVGVNAFGRKETTQAALIADGALDSVGSYLDPIKGIITTYWGGSTIFQAFHPGVDIAAPLGTPIHAAAAGLVTWSGYAVPGQRHASYGMCVIIQHNAHFSTLYAHLNDQGTVPLVHVGDTVQAGQVIGFEGLTGWTTGPHLHFEIRDNNVQVNPLLLIPNPQE